ncbi:MAG: transglycosylase domain-containing protein [Clostridiales Family XIII bacterium]|jgi:penicillin-binding protein 1A|nr:transglycosylase domain-containing protein [Clostridiales Family XIII bacterium]
MMDTNGKMGDEKTFLVRNEKTVHYRRGASGASSKFDEIEDAFRDPSQDDTLPATPEASFKNKLGGLFAFEEVRASSQNGEAGQKEEAGMAAEQIRRRSQRSRNGGNGGNGGRKPPSSNSSGGKKKGKKKQPLPIKILKGFVAAVLILVIIGFCYGGFTVYNAIKDLPNYDATEIQRDLKTMSTIYDDAGNPLKDIYLDDGQRTLITYGELPQNLVDAVIAIEDKTFWTHRGFNVVRMIGAAKDSVLGSGSITEASGTSTITQQLARNIWLADIKSERSIDRKIKEAYYARILEKELSKEEILTAYLNTIPLGNHSYGVGAAAKSYFNKEIGQLDLIECAAIAALPASPSTYSMIATVGAGEVAPDDPRILLKTDQYWFLYNDAAEDRIKLVLDVMLEQELITQEEHDAAYADSIRNHLHPQELEGASNASFFIDYLIEDVAQDLYEEFPGQFADIDEAIQRVYSGGLEIYSTFNQGMQDICTAEFENPENYPAAQLPRDGAGNVLSESNDVMLYAYENMFSEREDGPWFFLNPEDFEIREDGSMLIKAGGRLGIYSTTNPDGSKEVALEFLDFYRMKADEEGNESFYIVRGGIISIPRDYKGMDTEGNLVLPASFLSSDANIFTVEQQEDGTERWWIGPSHFTLRQEILQPQGATVIIEHHTGQIKAMVGGRNIEGQMQFNRATSPHSPGSTMKPIGAYGPALDMGANLEPVGGEVKTYGNYWTPLSIIIDEEMEYNGKKWPENWYSGYRGPQTLRNAVQQSVNVCAVKVQLAIGNQRSVNFLKKVGITTLVETGDPNDMGPGSLALGGMTNGVEPLEITSAYGTFANLGVHVDPISYTKITDRSGNTVLEGKPAQTQAMNAGAAYIMNDILYSTVSSGIATSAKVAGVPVAGKTGTNEKRNYDAWFVGNTPDYSMGVWLGCDLKVPMSKNSSASAALFSKIMAQIYEGREVGEFEPQPETVISATVDGMTDIFVQGTVPEKLDKGTEEVDVCTESGFLPTPWCPNHEVRKFTTLNSESSDPNDPANQRAPEYYCNLHNLDPAQFPNDPNYPINDDYFKKTVPDLNGKSVAEAEQALLDAGLVRGSVSQRDDAAPSGQVIGQSIAAGTRVEANTPVDIVTSNGKNNDKATIPNLIGRDKDDVIREYQGNAYDIKILPVPTIVPDPNYGSNIIISQTPGAGSTVGRNGTVTVTYNL